MKQKIRFYAKYLAIFIVLLCITKSPVFAQGNSGNNGQGKLWDKNNTTGNIYNSGLTNSVGVGTDNPQSTLDVKGKTCTDSLDVNNYINADSMHVRSLRVGDSSLWIGGTGPWTPGGWAGSDFIQSNAGKICFGRYPLMFSTVKIGVGTAAPLYKLSLFEQNYLIGGPAPAVFASFNNQGSGTFPGTGTLANDGLLIGIASNGNAQLIQQEDGLPISFYTNMGGTIEERMRIINNFSKKMNDLLKINLHLS